MLRRTIFGLAFLLSFRFANVIAINNHLCLMMVQIILPSIIQRNIGYPPKIDVPATNYQAFATHIYQDHKKLYSFLFRDNQQLQPYVRLLIGETFFDANYNKKLSDGSKIEVLMPMSGG